MSPTYSPYGYQQAATTTTTIANPLGGAVGQPWAYPTVTIPAAPQTQTYGWPQHQHTVNIPEGSMFVVQKISNGFIVHLRESALAVEEHHFAEDMLAVGKLVTATLVRWQMQGGQQP